MSRYLRLWWRWRQLFLVAGLMVIVFKLTDVASPFLGNMAMLALHRALIQSPSISLTASNSFLTSPFFRVDIQNPQLTSAHAWLDFGLKVNPDGGCLHRQSGFFHLIENDPSAARLALDQALLCHPADSWARLLRAWAAEYAGDRGKAVADWKMIGDNRYIRRQCDQWAHTGHLSNAVDCFRLALAIAPGDAIAYRNLSSVYLTLGDTQSSIAALRKAVELVDKSSIEHFLSLAELQRQTGDIDGAIDTYRQAITLRRADYRIWREVGKLLYYQRGMGEPAIEAYQEAIRLAPCAEDLYRNLAVIYSKLGRAKDAQVINDTWKTISEEGACR